MKTYMLGANGNLYFILRGAYNIFKEVMGMLVPKLFLKKNDLVKLTTSAKLRNLLWLSIYVLERRRRLQAILD